MGRNVYVPVHCCVGGGPPPTSPPPATPTRTSTRTTTLTPTTTATSTPCPLNPPTAENYDWTPPYPLTFGQDPDKLGFDATFDARGGTGVGSCPNQGLITAVEVEIRLSAGSINWINTDLAKKYPNAHVLGSYPFLPVLDIAGLGTPNATISFHYDPLDPGYYDINVTVTQNDGQTFEITFPQPVWLYEIAGTDPYA